ncbi:MAG: AbrB/MazE/SpoVT family DNA-binding domain-containing protein [Ignavibacteria bacterium]|nr:AbrB/MazE/SpoVT family DNA-binding domain-containing protein [Ignavibacteria bacterium]
MNTVTISPKYQVVIPRQIRESLNLQSGQKVQVIEFDGRVELIPLLSMQSLRGTLKIDDTTIEREEDRL